MTMYSDPSAQMIVSILNENKEPIKVYHIMLGSNSDLVYCLLSKNIFAKDLVNKSLNIKLIYSDPKNDALKEKMKDMIVFEIKPNYYVLDFIDLHELDKNNIEFLKEENFDELNYFNYKATAKEKNLSDSLDEDNHTNDRRLERDVLMRKLSSKMSCASSEGSNKNFDKLTTIELAFLGNYKNKNPNISYSHKSDFRLKDDEFSVAYSEDSDSEFETKSKQRRKHSADSIYMNNTKKLVEEHKEEDDQIIIQQEFVITLDFNIKIDHHDHPESNKVKRKETMTGSKSHHQTESISINEKESLPKPESDFSVKLWNIDKEMIEEIDHVINENMDWYRAKFHLTVDEIIRKNRSTKPIQIKTDIIQNHTSEKSDDSLCDEDEFPQGTPEKVEPQNPFKNLKFIAYKLKHNDELDQSVWNLMNNKHIVKNMLSFFISENQQYANESKIKALKIIEMLEEYNEETMTTQKYLQLKDELKQYILHSGLLKDE